MELATKEIDRCTGAVRSHLNNLAKTCFGDVSYVYVSSLKKPTPEMADEIDFSIRVYFKKRQDPITAISKFKEHLTTIFKSDDYTFTFDTEPLRNDMYSVTLRCSGPVRRMAGDIFKAGMEERRTDTIAERATLLGTRQERQKRLPNGSQDNIPQQR